LALIAGLAGVLAWWWIRDPGDAAGEELGHVASPSTASTAENGGSSPLDTGTTAATGSAETTPGNGAPGSGSAANDLIGVLIARDDLQPGAITLEESAVDSGRDPGHPLTDYRFCRSSPDLTAVGAGAKRVLTTNLLASDALVVSSASRATTVDGARAVVDTIAATAGSCDTYTQGLATVTVVGVDPTTDGAVIQLQVATGLSSDVPLTIIVTRTGDIVTTLEVTGPSSEQDRLQALLVERARLLAP
jgi:hypothetical protein